MNRHFQLKMALQHVTSHGSCIVRVYDDRWDNERTERRFINVSGTRQRHSQSCRDGIV
ncbi:MAG: hypothetical protein IID45_02125 [Planctomycetes bacterium]|nr:hypothetical protein [Planctomycetota bacterium]